MIVSLSYRWESITDTSTVGTGPAPGPGLGRDLGVLLQGKVQGLEDPTAEAEAAIEGGTPLQETTRKSTGGGEKHPQQIP